jgi:hypothetical protein
MSPTENGTLVKVSNLEIRTEVVAIISVCCDLVIRDNPKRKGIVISPLRETPRHIVKNLELMRLLKMHSDAAYATRQRVPVNIFYYEAIGGAVRDGVIHLEAVAMVDYDVLRKAEKLAELQHEWRTELQERIKRNFTRVERT